MSKRTDGRTAHEVAQVAMDLAARAGVAESQEAPAAPPENTEIQIDPQMLDQAKQMRNARLIATMVHENAMLEVALEQTRRSEADWKSKYLALLAAFDAA